MELYKDEDLRAAKRGMYIRVGVLAAILVLTVVALALFVSVWRNEIVAMAACAVGAAVFFFYLSMKAMPWIRYVMYQNDMKKGRAHELDCRFVSLSDTERMSDGVSFRDFIVTLDDAEGEDKERLLLWDADKKAPSLEPNQHLHVRAFGNYITALDAQ